MASSAGRRNILRELSSSDSGGASNNIPSSSSNNTPTSPDETVIQRRGKQKKSATYKYDAPDPVFFKTPTKSPKKITLANFVTPVKSPVRSSLRKRAVPADKMSTNEAAMAELSLTDKRAKNDGPCGSRSDIDKHLFALEHSQLVHLIRGAMKEVPEMKEVITKLFPHPNIAPAKSKLLKLQRAIIRSMPRKLWAYRDDVFSFQRVRYQLDAFSHECNEVCERLFISRHWPTAVEYFVFAMKLNYHLPTWSNVEYGKQRHSIKKQLINQMSYLIQQGNLDDDALAEIITCLETLQGQTAGDPDLEFCIEFANQYLEKARHDKRCTR